MIFVVIKLLSVWESNNPIEYPGTLILNNNLFNFKHKNKLKKLQTQTNTKLI